MSIKNVAVIGGSGNLGPAVVRALVAAGFTVTAVTRASSTATFGDKVAVKRVDYSSAAAVRGALQGQDAVVSTIATDAIGDQKALVDAAIAAGVRRFIPSEFGLNTREAADKPIVRMLGSKVAVIDYLVEKQSPTFSWTGIATGLFFDWALKLGLLGFDLANKKATIVDSGNEKWQASTLAQVGRAVAAVLRHPEQTANRYVSTASFNPSANEVLAAAEKATGGAKFEVTRVPSAAIRKAGEDKLAQGDHSAFLNFLQVYNFADGEASGYLDPKKCANEELGLAWENVDDVVAQVAKGA